MKLRLLPVVATALLAPATPAAADAAASSAQAAVRNAVTLMETCYVDHQDYRACSERVLRAIDPSLPWRRITVDRRTKETYRATARTSDGRRFTIRRTRDGGFKRNF